jgi:tetratricopeptide (TPR) repeat protein
MRVDLFALRRDGVIDGELVAPLRPSVPALVPGESYLLETVVRTLKMGHPFTQGTSDSNEIWLEVTATSGGRVIGKSGGLSDDDRTVDPWSHFVNAFVIDREGRRINRRNAQDIFMPLYSNQIPPGAADSVHFRLEVPPDATEPIEVEVALHYRKFDTEYMQFVEQDPDWENHLPVMTLARDRVVFPVGSAAPAEVAAPATAEWERWFDYGIGLFRKTGRGQLRQAEEVFKQVEALGRPEGPINLARVYLREGRITHEAPEALRRARDFDPPANEWQVLWFTGLVNKQNGRFDEAIANFRQLVEGGFAQAVGRNFDFSKDWGLLVELGNTLYERAKQERGPERREAREVLLREAVGYLEQALKYDSEDMAAHYNLMLIYGELGDTARSEAHAAQHAKYKPDDNATDRAIAAARMSYPAANHAAEGVVIYDLSRPEAFAEPVTNPSWEDLDLDACPAPAPPTQAPR